MSDISLALALTRTNIEMLRCGKLSSKSTGAPEPRRGLPAIGVPKRRTVEAIEWRNLGLNYWRTPRLDDRFEAMVVKGRDGGAQANVYSYVIFDYQDPRCSCVRIAKAKSAEEAKVRAEREVRVRGFAR